MSMSRDSHDALAQKVIGAIATMQKRAPESVRLESSFEELGIDSLNGFNLLCDLEEDFGITIPDDDAREMKRVQDVVDRIRQLIPANSP
jgi:acyl carrier protein